MYVKIKMLAKEISLAVLPGGPETEPPSEAPTTPHNGIMMARLVTAVDGSTATAAARVGAAPEAAAGEMTPTSRKRSRSRARKDDTGKKSSKGAVGPFVSTLPSARSSSLGTGQCRSSDQVLFGAGNNEQISRSQLNTLVNWVTANDNSSSPDWDAIDVLVESTGLKPSKVVACIEKLAGCRKSVQAKNHPEVITIDEEEEEDEVGVPELADEEDGDAWNVCVADADEQTPTAKRRSVSGKIDIEIGTKTELDVDVESPFDPGFEFGDLIFLEVFKFGRKK